MRILYVEDNPQDIALVRRALAHHEPPYVVDVATSLAQARQALLDQRYDAVLTDLNLPDGHGIDLLLEIREHGPAVPVVTLTGQGDESLVITALKSGADDYLAKTHGFEARLPSTLRAARARFDDASERHGRALRVLYAEHNGVDIDLMRRHFARHAANVQLETVHDAATALARLADGGGDIDVLLLDYRLAGDSGLEVLKVLREDRGSDLPVVMITGQGSEDVAAQAMRLGATDYVVKRDNHLLSLPAVLENAFHRVTAERERAALERSEERLALVLRGSSDAPWDIDLAHGEQYLSPRLWQLLGWQQPPAAAGLEDAQALMRADERESLRQRFVAALHGPGDTYETELHLRHRQGHEVPMLARGFISRGSDGRALRISGTCTDLTERKRSETQILELNATLERRVAERTRELQRANQELEAFSVSVSHDLRAPLRAIDGLSALLMQECGEALGSEGQRKLRLLRTSTARMDRLIHDLLEFSRSARQEPRRTMVPVAALVRHCLEEFRAEIDSRAIDVDIGPLPDGSADPTLLRQVFVNLLGNAVKYTRRQARPRIEVAAAQAEGEPVYLVRDNGAGFDMRHAGKLFSVFQRLHGEAEFEGTGVGLAIVDRIVQRHGGRVWAEAAPGAGATFFFTLGAPPPAP